MQITNKIIWLLSMATIFFGNNLYKVNKEIDMENKDKFRVAKKGYDTQEVDDYLSNLCNGYNKTIMLLRERVGELEHSNKEYFAQLQNYADKQDQINLTLSNAIEKARNIEFASKVQYSLESDRLADFVRRWTEYCDQNMPLDIREQNKELTDYLTKAKCELENMLTRELGMSKSLTQADLDYHAERERMLDFNTNAQ